MRRSDSVRRASLRAAARVGRTRRSATGVPEEWPSPPKGSAPRVGQNPAYTPSGTFKSGNNSRTSIRTATVGLLVVVVTLMATT